MNPVHRKRYTTEFKAQAVELLSTGKAVCEVAEELYISSNLLYGWRHRVQGAQLGSAGARAAAERSEADELRAIQPKTYAPKTSDGRADQPSPNLLLGQALPARPDQVWAGDICQRLPALPFGQRLRPLAICPQIL